MGLSDHTILKLQRGSILDHSYRDGCLGVPISSNGASRCRGNS